MNNVFMSNGKIRVLPTLAFGLLVAAVIMGVRLVGNLPSIIPNTEAPASEAPVVEAAASPEVVVKEVTIDPNPELALNNNELIEQNERLQNQVDLLTSNDPTLLEAVSSLRFPGLVSTKPENAGNPELRFDDPAKMEPRVWVTENNEACDPWVSSYTVLAGDAEQYLRDCTEWQVPPTETLDFTFEAQSGTYWNTVLDMLVTHDPVLAARMEGQPGREPMPWLAITPVTGITIDVWYEDGTYCEAADTAVIVTDQSMRVRLHNVSDTIHAKLGIGPGGDPDADVNLEAWTIGNDVPLPTCHPANWTPGQ